MIIRLLLKKMLVLGLRYPRDTSTCANTLTCAGNLPLPSPLRCTLPKDSGSCALMKYIAPDSSVDDFIPPCTFLSTTKNNNKNCSILLYNLTDIEKDYLNSLLNRMILKKTSRPNRIHLLRYKRSGCRKNNFYQVQTPPYDTVGKDTNQRF